MRSPGRRKRVGCMRRGLSEITSLEETGELVTIGKFTLYETAGVGRIAP